jgi:hypothetical protein
MIEPKIAPKTNAKAKKEQPELQHYIDTLIDNQKIISEAMESARLRGIRISDAVAKRAIKYQDESLKLAKKLSINPSAYKENVAALMESLVSAQTQSLDVFKAVLTEQTDMREEFVATTKSLFEGNRTASKAALELTRAWSKNNPIADAMKKSYESAKTVASQFAGKMTGEEAA